MKRDCVRFEDEIWEAGHTGSISLELKAHTRQCESCAQTLREATAISMSLRSSDCVLQATDCRTQIRQRIEAGKVAAQRSCRYAWVAATAAALLVITVYCSQMRPVSEPGPTPRVATKDEVIVTQRQTPQPAEPERKVVAQKLRARRSPADATLITGRRNEYTRRQSRAAVIAHKRAPEPAPTAVAQAPPEENKDERRPVSLVVVSWDQPQAAESHSYTIVEQTEHLVTVTMRSTPEEDNSNKGEERYETNSGV